MQAGATVDKMAVVVGGKGMATGEAVSDTACGDEVLCKDEVSAVVDAVAEVDAAGAMDKVHGARVAGGSDFSQHKDVLHCVWYHFFADSKTACHLPVSPLELFVTCGLHAAADKDPL